MFIPATLIFAPLGGAGTPAVVLSLVILLWYVASWSVGSITPSGSGGPIRITMLAFAMTVLTSFIAGMTRNITQVEVLSADRGLIILVGWFGLIVVVSQSITSYDQLDVLLRRAVVFGSVVASIGIFEFFSNINIVSYIQIPGLSVNSAITDLTLYRNGFIRPSSTAIQPIEFGVVMAMLLPFALQQAFDPTRIGRFRKWGPVALNLVCYSNLRVTLRNTCRYSMFAFLGTHMETKATAIFLCRLALRASTTPCSGARPDWNTRWLFRRTARESEQYECCNPHI